MYVMKNGVLLVALFECSEAAAAPKTEFGKVENLEKLEKILNIQVPNGTPEKPWKPSENGYVVLGLLSMLRTLS